MNDDEDDILIEINDEDYYIKSFRLVPGGISPEDKKLIMNSMLHGDRVFFGGLNEGSPTPFNVIIFSRYAGDSYVEEYLDSELGYDPVMIISMLKCEDINSQTFLNRFANVPGTRLEGVARKTALDRLEKYFTEKPQEKTATELMNVFNQMSTEKLAEYCYAHGLA